MEDLVNSYKNAFSRYADFSGRTGVAGFWYFVAGNFAVTFILFVLAGIIDFFFILYFLYALAVLIPGLAVAVRRLHDTGKSGWFVLVGLIPLVGFIIMIVFCAQPSDGPNEYGSGPQD